MFAFLSGRDGGGHSRVLEESEQSRLSLRDPRGWSLGAWPLVLSVLEASLDSAI